MKNVNCTKFLEGKCLHPAAPRKLFGARCLLTEQNYDPRVVPGCVLQVMNKRPPSNTGNT